MFLFKQTTANFRNINILFAPGLPGEMTQRPIFDDLSALGCDIYSFYYSGTYEQVGIFDLEQANKDLVNAIQEMEDKKLPFIILGYSFSTYFLQKIDLAQYSNILGLSMFSPIMGLDPKSIKANFFEELETLHKDSTQPFKCNLELLKTQIPASELNFDYSLSKFALYNFPVTFAYSLNDTLINVDTINYKLQNYRIQHTYNKFLVWDSSEGYHRLDTYYNNSMKAYFEGLFIAADLKRLIDDEVYVYFWGSQITQKSNKESDIDLLIFTKSNHLIYTKILREYQDEHAKIANLKFDLSINTLEDIYTKKSYRFNRGPSITHELTYHYFGIYKIPHLPIVQTYDLLEDCYQATLTNLNEARKILLKTSLTSERVKKIPKFTIFALIYLQYYYNHLNIDWSKIKDYYLTNSEYHNIISKIEKIQAEDYQDLNIEFLQVCVEVMEKIHKEQEHVLATLQKPNPIKDKQIKSFYLMRHAEKNRQESHNSLINAELDITTDGKAKTESVAEYLLQNKIEVIYASNYKRSVSTAQIIADRLDLQVKQEELIHEKIFSTDNLSDEQAFDLYNKSFEDWDYSNHGSESINQAVTRLKRGLVQILEKEDHITTLMVSHGRVMQSFFNSLENFTEKDFKAKELMIDYSDVYQVFYRLDGDALSFVGVIQVL